MNKKLFVLLPAAMMILTACGGGTTSGSTSSSTSGSTTSGSTTSGSSTSDPVDNKYGTAEAPLSVSEFFTNVVDLVKAEKEAFSEKEFYVKGYNDTNATNGGSYLSTFYMKDSAEAEKSLKVAKAVLGSSGVTELGKGDDLVIKGFAEYYNDTYSIYGAAEDAAHPNPEVLSCTRGTVAVTTNHDSHSSFASEVPATAVNGSILQVTVAADSGYKIDKVTCNGANIAAVDGKYPCKVMGPTEISVTSILDVVPQDVEDGTYTPKINNTNSGLTSSAGNATANVAIKADTATVVYKKLVVEYTNCYNQDNYGEVTIKQGGKMKISTPTGKIKSIKADFYKSVSCDVRVGSESAEKTTGTEDTMVGSKGVVRKYIVNNKDVFLTVDAGSTYSQSFYNIEVEIFVGTEKTITHLDITTPPAKTTYTEGESFDKAGMVVTATYSDSTTGDVTGDCVVSPAGALATTDVKVTLTCGGQSVEQAITVNPAAATAYSLPCAKEEYGTPAGNGDYASFKERTVNGVTWQIQGNLTVNNWGFGGKFNESFTKALYSQTAIAGNIARVEIDFGTTCSLTVNKIVISVYDTAEAAAAGTGEIASIEGAFPGTSKTGSYSKADSTSWAGKFFRITFNLTSNTTSNNKRVDITEVRFYA